MTAIQADKDKITIEFAKDELGVLCNALNEVCNGIDVREFDTRIGIKVEEARAMLECLTSIYRDK